MLSKDRRPSQFTAVLRDLALGEDAVYSVCGLHIGDLLYWTMLHTRVDLTRPGMRAPVHEVSLDAERQPSKGRPVVRRDFK